MRRGISLGIATTRSSRPHGLDQTGGPARCELLVVELDPPQTLRTSYCIPLSSFDLCAFLPIILVRLQQLHPDCIHPNLPLTSVLSCQLSLCSSSNCIPIASTLTFSELLFFHQELVNELPTHFWNFTTTKFHSNITGLKSDFLTMKLSWTLCPA